MEIDFVVWIKEEEEGEGRHRTIHSITYKLQFCVFLLIMMERSTHIILIKSASFVLMLFGLVCLFHFLFFRLVYNG